MSEVIDLTAARDESVLFDSRVREHAAGSVAWPYVERRRGPRRMADGIRVDRRVPPEPQSFTYPPRDPARDPRDRIRHVRGYLNTVYAIDAAAALFGSSVAYVSRFGSTHTGYAAPYLWGSLLLPLLWIAAIAISRAYEVRFLASSADEYRRVLDAGVGLIAAIAVVAYLFRAEFARGYVVVTLPLSVGVSLLGRYLARRALRRQRASGRCLQDVLVVGHEWAVLDLVAALRQEPDAGLRVIGACLPGGQGSRRMTQANVPVLGDLGDVAQVAELSGADVVAVTTCVEFDGSALRKVCWALENTGVDILVAPALVEVAGPRLHIRPVANLPLLHVEKPEFTGARRVAKGLFDRTLALACVSLLAPLFIGIAIAVRLDSTGPVFFRQTRVGIRGQRFTMYKFRSMHADAEARLDSLRAQNDRADGLLFKMRVDPRITRVGRWLRRYSLDELPQLLNVVRGDMSLVGPRPPLPREVEGYGDDDRRRLLVRPGVTGLWQVSGRSDLTWEETVRLDLRYVENWSLIYDFQILWRTGYAVLHGSGAY